MNSRADHIGPRLALDAGGGPRVFRSQRIVLDGHRTLDLDDRTLALRVINGHVDLFAVQVLHDATKGRRHHLFRVQVGETIFGIPVSIGDGATALRVMAVGSPGTEVLLHGRGEFDDKTAVDHWVERWTRVIAPPVVDIDIPEIEVGRQYALAPGERWRAPRNQVAWVSVTAGAVRLSGAADIFDCAGLPMAIAPGTWIEASEHTIISAQQIRNVDPSTLISAIERFHALVIARCTEKILSDERAEAERLKDSDSHALLRTQNVFGRLANIMGGHFVRRAIVGPDSGALIAACEEVASAMGVQIVRPATSRSIRSDIANIFEIAQSSRLRARRVVLRADWWNHVSGPMVGWYGEDQRPVAIVLDGRHRPVMIDAEAGSRVVLDQAAAERVRREAVVFYPTLTSQVRSAWGLIRFGLRPIKDDIARILLSALSIGVLTIAAPLVTHVLINSVIPRAEVGQLAMCAIALLVVTLVSAGFQAMQGIGLLRLESTLDWALQAAILDRLLQLPVSFFKRYSSGDLADRTLGIHSVRAIITGRAVRGIFACISCIFCFALMLCYNFRLAFLAIVLAIIRAAVVVSINMVRLPHERKNFDFQGKLQGLVLQFLVGVGKLRIAHGTLQAISLWASHFTTQKQHFLSSQRAANLLRTIEATSPTIATIVLFAFAQHYDDALLRNMGAFLAFFAAFGLSLMAIGEWSTAMTELLIVVPRFDRLRPILSTVPESADQKSSPDPMSGALEFADVSFRYYPGGPLILDGVNISINSGEYVAVVGPSGSGKSTLFRLLLGFERPETGVVFFDGKAIETLDISAVRRRIGVVLQNSKLVSGSLYENICGSVQLPIDEVWRVVRLAGLEDDIKSMPMGVHTVVSEGINTLSGGQRQRLLIARALVRHPKILLMDEATSALDNQTQSTVSASLAKFDITRIVIAHRLSTVQFADRIVVLDGGRVVQSGTFSELSAQPGLFADFICRQMA